MQRNRSGRRDRAAGVILGAAVTAALFCGAARADVLAKWGFNDSTLNPSVIDPNLSYTISAVGGVTPSFGSATSGGGSTDLGLAYQLTAFPAQGTNDRSAGLHVTFDTTSFSLSSFNFDLRTSNSSSRYFELQYTLDGTNWTAGQLYTSPAGDFWNNNNSFDLSGIAAASGNPNFGIRIVSVFSPVGFTTTTVPIATFGPNEAYRAANPDDRNYAASGTWRFDAVTLNGTYVSVPFTPRNLAWNTASGTWDTLAGNQPWLDGGTPASFSQVAGQGDNVTISNPADGSVITVQAAGVTPNSMTIANSGTLTLTGGGIGGGAGLAKSGAGRLILTGTNTFRATLSSSNISQGVLETRATNAMGIGPVSIGNATWNSTTAAQSSAGTVTLTGPVTFDVAADLTLAGGLAGTGALLKVGPAMLAVGGVGTSTGDFTITAGSLRMDNMGALGGNSQGGGPTPTLTVTDASLLVNSTGNNSATRTRISGDINLHNAVIQRLQLTPGLGPSPSNGDSEFSSYGSGAVPGYVGGIMTVSGTTTLSNTETRTAAASDNPGGGGSNNALVVRMPVIVSSGATLILHSLNATRSIVGGLPTGSIANTAVALRSVVSESNPNDSLTIKPGATVQMDGPGEKRIGSTGTGKPIIGLGTTTSESTFKADGRTFLTDLASTGSVNSLLVVAGSGLGGLRIEAPMNAVYNGNDALQCNSGLLGTNPDVSANSIGNVYTLLSPDRFASLSGFADSPTTEADGVTPITRGGTLTLAASDPAGATGAINDGPATATPVKLGLDNAAGAGNLLYTLSDAVVPAAALGNFGGLVLRQSNGSGGVTAQLLNDVTLTGGGAQSSYDQLGGTLDLNGRTLTVAGPALLQAGVITGTAGSALSAGTMTKTDTGTLTVTAPAALLPADGTLAVQQGQVLLDANAGAPAQAGPTPAAARLTIHVTGGAVTFGAAQDVSSIISTVAGGVNLAGQTLRIYTLADEAAINSAVEAGRVVDGSIGGNPWQIGVTDQILDAAGNPMLLVKVTRKGDANLDGTTNFTDLLRLSQNYNQSSKLFDQADFTYDGTVNFNDLLILSQNYNQSYPSAGAAAVPEPAAVTLLLLAGLALGRRRGRAQTYEA